MSWIDNGEHTTSANKADPTISSRSDNDWLNKEPSLTFLCHLTRIHCHDSLALLPFFFHRHGDHLRSCARISPGRSHSFCVGLSHDMTGRRIIELCLQSPFDGRAKEKIAQRRRAVFDFRDAYLEITRGQDFQGLQLVATKRK